jgi:uncharacterized protein YcfL
MLYQLWWYDAADEIFCKDTTSNTNQFIKNDQKIQINESSETFNAVNSDKILYPNQVEGGNTSYMNTCKSI